MCEKARLYCDERIPPFFSFSKVQGIRHVIIMILNVSCFVRGARIGIISFVCCARIIIYIYCPATGCSLFDMSHPNSPVAKETLKDHVGSSTVPSNATLQIRVSKPWSLRKFSPRRRSPQKRHNRYKIILPRHPACPAPKFSTSKRGL